MEYHGNRLCISAQELVEGGIMTMPNYKAMSARGRIDVVRRGSRGGCALVAVDSLPTTYKEKVDEVYPGGPEVKLSGWITSNYTLDQAAVAYYMDWASSHHSDHATAELAKKYAVNASVLNTCIKLYDRGQHGAEADGRRVQLGDDGRCHRDPAQGTGTRPARLDPALPQEGERV